MNLRAGLYSFLLSAASSAAMTQSEIEAQCRCTCKMRPPVPEVVCSDERLETLCTAVSALPDLADTLAREDVVYTIFAPTDEGFANLPDGALDSLVADPAALENLILLHTIVGFTPICAEDLRCANIMYMANGQNSKTACSFADDGAPQGDDATGEPGEEPTAIFQKGRGNGSSKGNMPKIIAPDQRAKNGVLHIVDNVILQKDTLPPPPPAACTGGASCGDCKGECSANDGCRFSKVGWCKRDCEERFGWDNGALCPGGGGDDDGTSTKVCFGGFDCASCQKEMVEQEGCGREPAEEGVIYCEEKWGACQCTGGDSCGSCKGECQNNDGCRFSKTGWCKRDCEERFGGDNALCEGSGGDDQPPKQCFGSDHCAGCKKECDDNNGCGRESTEECFHYCEEKYGVCPYP